MTFWMWFLLIHLFCFLPFWVANLRQQKNPIGFLTEKRFQNTNKLKLVYTKHGFSDPFHFHIEFALLLCVFLTMGWTGDVFVWLMAVILTLFQIEIIYTAVLTYIFSRPPVFRGDWPLIKSGWILWKENRHWLVLGLIKVVAILFVISAYLSHQLFASALEIATQETATQEMGNGLWLSVLWAISLLMLMPAIFNWRTYDYTAFHYRTVYSTLLHITRNVHFGRQFNILFKQNSDFFDAKNIFKQVELNNPPDVVNVCVESYGAIVFKDPDKRARLQNVLLEFEKELQQKGFHMASSLSTSPIFTGGSWLSYSTFMYGFRFDNLQLYDGLFQYSDNFSSYESIFHVLNRNGYHHALAAPLGGVDNKDVSWDTISRCFQPETIFDWAAYDYHGPKLRFFNQKNTYCMPDQYALNFAYNKTLEQAENAPVSVFYCTMNSHVPYESPREIAGDWREVNNADYQLELTDPSSSVSERYLQAIEYQLKFILSFVQENSERDIVVTLFGDHQPPFVATEAMGRETPVHVLCKSQTLQQNLIKQGFHNGLLMPADIQPIKHEAWQSLFLQSMNYAYGINKKLNLPILSEGINLFPKQGRSGI